MCIACLQKGIQQARKNLYSKDVYDVRSHLKVIIPLKAHAHLVVSGILLMLICSKTLPCA